VAYLTLRDVRQAFERSQRRRPIRKTAGQVLKEEVASATDTDHFDVFLSHCIADADLIAGVKAYLEEQGQTVYVDWVVDNHLERQLVTPKTADLLRQRMRQSDSMVFATSESSPNSKWMPWELGYFDGMRQGRIAVLPLVATEGGSFKGQEYLGLYPTVEKFRYENTIQTFVTKGAGSRTYMTLGSFRQGSKAYQTF
jgi:hypothetical protein